MFFRSSGRVVPPLGAGRSPTNEIYFAYTAADTPTGKGVYPLKQEWKQAIRSIARATASTRGPRGSAVEVRSYPDKPPHRYNRIHHVPNFYHNNIQIKNVLSAKC